MNQNQTDLSRFDAWIEDSSAIAALVMRQWLVPVQGKDAVIFPPTYPMPGDKPGYNIDRFPDGTNVCQIDSVGSQANRMEPIFKRDRYRHLVPQVVIRADGREIHLLDAGHRAADAIVRFSTLWPRLHEAFISYQNGDAEPLARIAPTSIVFGAWDSRATQVKIPRVVRSVIRAYNVDVLTRSAQYSTVAGEILGEAEVVTTGPKADLGLAHVPAVSTHGGVKVRGDIIRDAILNLAALRAVGGKDADKTKVLRRYILGLALVSITAPQEPNLREGCELVTDPERKPSWALVLYDGSRTPFTLSHEEALDFATAAARAFGVHSDIVVGEFQAEVARKLLELPEKERKKLLKQPLITLEDIKEASKQAKSKAKEDA